ncbi:chromosomal replication initiator protein DnaA [Candidatus Margulisiibacteriota bacterium]
MAKQVSLETERQVFSIDQIWGEILSNLQKNLSTPGFELFSTSVLPDSYTDGVLILNVSNQFTVDWVKERCEHIIRQHIQNIFNISIPILYKVQEISPEPVERQKRRNIEDIPQVNSVIDIPEVNSSRICLNPKYTFETFVVGDCNRFTHAACTAVSEAPAKAYNPLFIYGGVGLGKTHLLHAIAKETLDRHPSWKVVYVSSEVFTNDLINSLRDQRIPEFRNKYRHDVDMLLMDDIQFIAGKEKTEEEFFHTFNAIHSASKQIIVTSDRSPKELKTLGDRLRSRFEWGLMADIQPPELETRIAILRKKAEEEHLDVPEEVLDFIATQVPSNVRELEGALTRIVAYGSLVHKQLSVPFAENVIKDMVSHKRNKPVTISLIKRVVSEYFNIPIEDLSVRKRTKEIAEARQVAMFLSRDMTTSSLPKIGEEFGGRDHTTVMHACDKIKEVINVDPSFKQKVEEVKNILCKS